MTIVGTPSSVVGALRSEIESSIAAVLDRADLTTNISEWFNTAYYEIQRLTNFKAAEFTTSIATVTQDDIDAKVDAYTLTVLPALLKNIDMVYTFDLPLNKVIQVYGKTSIQQLRVRRRESDPVNSLTSSSIVLGGLGAEWDNSLYAVWAGRLEFWPPVGPNQLGQDFRLDGTQWLQPPESDQQDWFTINARDWLKYRALMESAPFLVDDPRLVTWKDFAERAKMSILGAEVEAQTGGENLQMRG